MPKAVVDLRPELTLSGDLSLDSAQIWRALERKNNPPHLFVRGNSPIWANVEGADVTIRELGHTTLRRFATDRLQFSVNKKGRLVPMIPKDQVFINMLAGVTFPLPRLNRITPVPTFSNYGELHSEAGYCPTTANIYAPARDFILSQDVARNPTTAELREAKNLLREVICDFPFTSESSRTHALAALIQPFVREMIDGPTPLYLIFKPKEGTGSTLLAEVLAFPGCGRAHLMPFPNDEGECRRAISSVLGSSPGCIVLDNVVDLKSQVLASCLTSLVFRDRQVGASRMIEVPNRCLWVATGNNPDLSGEIARRSVFIKLDALHEHPDQREDFKHPELLPWVRENHGNIAWAALSVISNWIAAGRPAGQRVMGSFESWSRVIGGILDAAEIEGFLADTKQTRQKTDLESHAFRAFVEVWSTKCGDKELTARELLGFAGGLDLGSGERVRRLGKVLQKRTDQRFGDWLVKKATMSRGTQRWRLQRVVDEVRVVDTALPPIGSLFRKYG